ncbi:olfactory receptor 2D3-like [Hemicordylus capensis]|uniref:olfactory receptor 2D3-like n=1 Tax=Hemicordylus capensis TaxID=884348 RepID=UPI002303DEE7|nr:olfactory receptor 2D3-like [Hemicordylus capensis]
MGPGNQTSIKEFIFVGLSSQRKTQILLFVIILIIYILTVVENLVIILLVRMDSHLHMPMYFFLMNLSILEICYVSASIPQMLANLLSGSGVISFGRCAAQMYFGAAMGCVECLLLAVMAYDRYLAICCPLLYVAIMHRWRQRQLAIASWAVGFLIATIDVSCTFRHPFCGPSHINHFMCEQPMVLKLACGDTRITEAIMFVNSAVVFLGPLSVIFTSYMLILSSIIRMRSSASQHKAFSTCGSHLVIVTIFYGTAMSVYMKPRSGGSPDLEKQIAVFYVAVTPLFNPIIYTLRNKDVHGAMARVLQRRKCEQNGLALTSWCIS